MLLWLEADLQTELHDTKACYQLIMTAMTKKSLAQQISDE